MQNEYYYLLGGALILGTGAIAYYEYEKQVKAQSSQQEAMAQNQGLFQELQGMSSTYQQELSSLEQQQQQEQQALQQLYANQQLLTQNQSNQPYTIPQPAPIVVNYPQPQSYQPQSYSSQPSSSQPKSSTSTAQQASTGITYPITTSFGTITQTPANTQYYTKSGGVTNIGSGLSTVTGYLGGEYPVGVTANSQNQIVSGVYSPASLSQGSTAQTSNGGTSTSQPSNYNPAPKSFNPGGVVQFSNPSTTTTTTTSKPSGGNLLATLTTGLTKAVAGLFGFKW